MTNLLPLQFTQKVTPRQDVTLTMYCDNTVNNEETRGYTLDLYLRYKIKFSPTATYDTNDSMFHDRY